MTTVGIDEVGRGCWAGPLVAGAVILNSPIEGLKDSKKLTSKQRELLSEIILDRAQAVGLGWVKPGEVDRLGLTGATRLTMRRALEQIGNVYDEVIIDGAYNYLLDNPKSRTLIKADAHVPAVSAASIVAKVARDNYMSEIAKDYPQYGFEQHVGYGTALHVLKLKEYGVSKIHRLSYKPVKELLA